MGNERGEFVRIVQDSSTGRPQIYGTLVAVLSEAEAEAGGWEGTHLVSWDHWPGLHAYQESDLEKLERRP